MNTFRVTLKRVTKKALNTPMITWGHWLGISQSLLGYQCHLCSHRSHSILCIACREALPFITESCATCGIPMHSSAQLCATCQLHPRPFRRCLTPFIYQQPLSELIKRYKTGSPIPLGSWFAQEMYQVFSQHYSPTTWPDLLIPVPSHWQKRLQRGYNPAQDLAIRLAALVNRPTRNPIRWVHKPDDQKFLDRKNRLRNIEGAIECTANVTGQTIAVIDDIVTSGATATAMATTLKEHGALQVDIWALARTP